MNAAAIPTLVTLHATLPPAHSTSVKANFRYWGVRIREVDS